MIDSLLGIVQFCVVFLLLGLLVTCLVQATQNICNWRATLLKQGLNQLAQHLVIFMQQGDKDKLSNALLSLTQPQLPQSRYLPKAFLAQINHVSLTEIRHQVNLYFATIGELDSAHRAQLSAECARYFARLETEMTLSFRAKTHLTSFVCAAVLAFSFQINVFSLADNAINANLGDTPASLFKPQQVQTQFTLLPHGVEYFYKIANQTERGHFSHASFAALISAWLGMFFATIFISLGAPFWYQKIHSLLTLRAQLSSAEQLKN